jgi:hypothetical protein
VPEPIQAATDWLTSYQQFWEAQFKSLAEFLKQDEEGGI